ncbi:MAG: single-stranded-DNA-specific exonuclease RecJ [Pedobacter sp.]
MTEFPNKLWLERSNSECLDSEDLQRSLGISRITAEALLRRELSSLDEVQAFLQARLSSMPDPYLMADMGKAVERLGKAVRDGEGISVHGDYDVDGVTGTALLVETLRAFGARVDYSIPLRLRDGYGVSDRALESCAGSGAALVITVDCGISAHAQAERARELGLDLIITDHHQPPDILPEALAILNPARSDCPFPFKSLAGVGVVFMLLVALRKHLRESGYRNNQPEPDLRFGLDLVALGTIADIVPLKGLNRALTKAGLELLSHSGRAGLQALKKVAGVEKVNCGTVGFRLAPRINAAGRLEDAAVGVELLLGSSVAGAMPTAELLDQVNSERQTIEQQTLEQADERWQQQSEGATHSIVLADERWHPGVIGIVASRLVEKYHRPTILIALNNGVGKGSGRSIKGLHLYRALADCGPFLQGFGGHEYAAGLTIDADKVAKFARMFEDLARQRLSAEDLLPRQFYDGEVSLEDLDLDAVDELSRLAPFGAGNPQPVYLVRGVFVQGAQVIGGSHLRFVACQGAHGLPCIAFGMGALHDRLSGPQDILFTPQRNDWRGKSSLQLQVRDIRPTSLT